MKMQIPLLVVLTFAAAMWSSQPVDEKPVWHNDWPTAQRIARQTGKPIFAVLVCKH